MKTIIAICSLLLTASALTVSDESLQQKESQDLMSSSQGQLLSQYYNSHHHHDSYASSYNPSSSHSATSYYYSYYYSSARSYRTFDTSSSYNGGQKKPNSPSDDFNVLLTDSNYKDLERNRNPCNCGTDQSQNNTNVTLQYTRWTNSNMNVSCSSCQCSHQNQTSTKWNSSTQGRNSGGNIDRNSSGNTTQQYDCVKKGLLLDKISGQCVEYCQDSQVPKNGTCINRCPDNNHVWNETSKNCEDCQFWEKKADGKCISRCTREKSYNRYNQKCINMQDLQDDHANFLKNKTNSQAASGSLSNELNCGGQNYSAPLSKTLFTLYDYIYVELKVRSRIGSGDDYWELKMLMPQKSYLKLAAYDVDMNDSQTIQCTSDKPKACWNFWYNQIDAYQVQNYYSNGMFEYSYYEQMKNGQLNGIYRLVYNNKNYDDTYVSWMKDGEQDGKTLVYKNGVCQQQYYVKGNQKENWQGNDLATQFEV